MIYVRFYIYIYVYIYIYMYVYIYIYINYERFDSVNLTLQTVTSIHSSQLRNKIQLETLKQDESCQKIQNQRERERNQVSEKRSLRKRNKKIALRKKFFMHHLKVILILLLENISSEIIHPDVVITAMNLFSNCRTNWSYYRSCFIKII